jgi:hypothetical protein
MEFNMALTERTTTDLIEVLENGCLQIREANIVERDGVAIAKTFHRYVLSPGDDVSTKEQKIQNIAAAVWTPEILQAWQSRQT